MTIVYTILIIIALWCIKEIIHTKSISKNTKTIVIKSSELDKGLSNLGLSNKEIKEIKNEVENIKKKIIGEDGTCNALENLLEQVDRHHAVTSINKRKKTFRLDVCVAKYSYIKFSNENGGLELALGFMEDTPSSRREASRLSKKLHELTADVLSNEDISDDVKLCTVINAVCSIYVNNKKYPRNIKKEMLR